MAPMTPEVTLMHPNNRNQHVMRGVSTAPHLHTQTTR
jgi:hypothetical protein